MSLHLSETQRLSTDNYNELKVVRHVQPKNSSVNTSPTRNNSQQRSKPLIKSLSKALSALVPNTHSLIGTKPT